MKSLKQAFDAAFAEAECAKAEGEIPVGAVIVKDDEIIARAHNLRETEKSPTAHAEVLAIEEAAKKLSDWRLSDCSLVVTLEPCPMCAGAILNARIRRVYFAAYDPEFGAAGSRFDLFDRTYEIYGGINEKRSQELLTRFFELRRKGE